jgi:Hint domain
LAFERSSDPGCSLCSRRPIPQSRFIPFSQALSLVDGVLIAVEYLVNDRSVTPAKMDDSDVLEYFHVELETHEVIFAEGAPAETLHITTGREQFVNFVEYERLYGSDERPSMKPFAPVFRDYGGRAELQGLLRLALSPVVDLRDPVQRARVRIAARAERVSV